MKSTGLGLFAIMRFFFSFFSFFLPPPFSLFLSLFLLFQILVKLLYDLCEQCDYEGDYEKGQKMIAHINKLSFLVNPLDGGYFWQVFFLFFFFFPSVFFFKIIFQVITGKEELSYAIHRQFLSFFGVLFSYKQSPFVKVPIFSIFISLLFFNNLLHNRTKGIQINILLTII